MRHSSLALALAGSLVMPASAAAQDYSCTPAPPASRITGLGALYPDESYATAVTEFGRVVGWSTVALGEGVLGFGGFVWTRGEGMVPLAGAGVPIQFPAGMNLRGQVVGSAWTVGGYQHVLLFTPGEGVIDLTPGPIHAAAADINERGDVAATFVVDGHDRAMYFSPATGWVETGTLGGRFSVAHGLNNLGDVVGASETADGAWHGFLWNAKHGIQPLAGDGSSVAYAINDRREIVGTSGGQAVIWTRSGAPVSLGAIDEYGTGSVALDINELSQVVGYAGSASSDDERAFLWTAATGMTALGSLAPESCASSAVRINNAGQAVGWSRTSPGAEPYPFKQAVVWDIALTRRQRLASVRIILRELRLTGRVRRADVLNLLGWAERELQRLQAAPDSAEPSAWSGGRSVLRAIDALAADGTLTSREAQRLRTLLR